MKLIKYISLVSCLFLLVGCTNSNNDNNSEKNVFHEDYESLGTKGYLNSKDYIDPSYSKITYSENNPLLFGNPSKATCNELYECNYLMEKDAYTHSYNNVTHISNWVAWHFVNADTGSVTRSDKRSGGVGFHSDSDLPDSWYKVTSSDFQYNPYGFDRGHMCPSGDRTADEDTNDQTFCMSNMIPQSPNNNQKVWAALEDYERKLVSNGNELYIFCGPYGIGGTNNSDTTVEYITLSSNTTQEDNKGIVVPSYCWRITVVFDSVDDTNDLNRFTKDTDVIAVLIPNTKDCTSNGDQNWQQYAVSVDEIETLTGYDFFTNLEDSVESEIESEVYGQD